jgi:hypothetical protein
VNRTTNEHSTAGAAASAPHWKSPAAASIGEKVFIAILLVGVLSLQLRTAFHLHALMAFDQYNLFFDADSNQYVSAVAHGWSFNRQIHPGFALFFNVPARGLDALLTAGGLIQAGTFRSVLPIALPPLCGLIGSLFLWFACVRAGLSVVTRIGTIVLLEGSSSQLIFTAIPESYPVSGMLYCVLIWLAALAASDRSLCGRRGFQVGWSVLCIAMTGVTVTHGLVCTAVWLALRLGTIAPRRWIIEGVVGACLVLATIAVLKEVDQRIYALPPAELTDSAKAIGNFGLASAFVPSSVASRVIALPGHALASLVAPPAMKIRNQVAELSDSRFKFGFSFIESSVTRPRLIVAWILFVAGIAASVSRLRISPLARAVAAVLAFNLALHSVWGLEVFLYSQHWVACLVFAIAAGVDRVPRFGGPALLALASGIAWHNATQVLAMSRSLGS